MKDRILSSLPDPEALETLYREDKAAFTEAFPHIAEENDTELVHFWKLRLESYPEATSGDLLKSDLLAAAIIAFIAALLSRLPLIFGSMDGDWFYLRNLPIIVFSALIAYTLWQKKITTVRSILFIAIPIAVLALFLNLLPDSKADTATLAFIHAPLLLWCLFGLTWLSMDYKIPGMVFRFIRYNGELLIMSGLIIAAGIILSIMTISLFSMIGMDIAEFYMENIAFMGAVATPIVAAWVTARYPSLTSRIFPVIARVFTPLVLVSAIIYLLAIFFSGVNVSENRELLVMFNLLLLAVMAILVFSISEIGRSRVKKLNLLMLLLLVMVTLVINIIALIAIISRLSEGFTPNRTVVLVSNILVFVHLLLVLPALWKARFAGSSLDPVENAVVRYLPVYFVYTLFVIFVMPFLFN